MDKRTFMKKLAIWVAVVAAVIIAVIGLCFGKVIEGSLFAEVMKWVVVGAGVIVILEVFTFTIGQLIWDFNVRKKE